MWILTKEATDENLILLPHKDKYSVGRAGTDLVLKDDLCISRTHAFLHVIKSEIPKLELEDTGSKYGTFHNEGIAANKPIDKLKCLSLQDGDKIRFGVLKNIWHVKQLRIATMASALTSPQKQQLEKAMNALGGTIEDSWSITCTHLTMCEVSVTVKLIYALLEQIPVVHNNYWIELFKLAKNGMFKGSLPKPEAFAPRHPTDMVIGRCADRQKLFQGKTFVFMNRKHFEVYSPIVRKASGTCKDLNTGVKKTFLTKDNVIVIQFVPSSQSQATETINNITGILEQSSLRIIPEYEIGLAIVHCSTEKYCNPKYKPIQNIMPTEENTEKNLPTCTVFAENTADENQRNVNTNSKSEVIVPETESTNKNTCKQQVQPIVIDSDDDQDEPEHPVNSSIPSISITESKAEENSQQNKRKRLTRRRQVMYDTDEEDDEDDEVFQFNKIPKKKVEDNKEEPEKSPRRISLRNQQQQASAVINDKTKTSENSTPTTVKRTRNETSMDQKENAAKKIRITTELSECEPSTSRAAINNKNVINAKKNPKTPVTELVTNGQSSPTSETENTTSFSESLKNKRPLSSDKRTSAKKPTPSRMKPLPLTQVRNISLAGFLEKSQAPAVQSKEDVNSQSSSNSGGASVTRKRTRISVLRESDDDEDNLFNFGDAKDSQTAKKSRTSSVFDRDNSDDDLFGFKETNQAKGEHAEKTEEDGDEEDLVETQPLLPGFKSCGSSYVLIKPKPLPRKISLIGWLSCSIKTEDSGGCKTEDGTVMVKEEQTSDNDDTDEHAKWLKTLMNGIEVRISSLSVSSTKAPQPDEIDATTQQQNETLGNRKNFKSFVKKCNPHPQKRIIKLVSHCPNVKA